MTSTTRFLRERLKLRVNPEKSAVDRPWNRKFPGCSMTPNLQPRLKAAPRSVERLKSELRTLFRQGRGRNIPAFIRELAPVMRGWVNYFCLAEVKDIMEELDGVDTA
jgi:RNA-directed DNA polymerase